MPKLLALPKQDAVITDARLAIHIDDLPADARLLRDPDGKWRLNVSAKQIVRVGDDKPEAAFEFCCSILDAAQICDIVRQKNAEARVYLCKATAWSKVPASVDLTVFDHGEYVLNKALFGHTAVAVAAAEPDDHVDLWQQSETAQAPPEEPVKFLDTDAWPQGGRADGEGQQALPSDREDALDEDVEIVFGDGNVVPAANGAWLDTAVKEMAPLPGFARKEKPAKPRALKRLALPVARTYQQHYDRWHNCQNCDLGMQRSQIVLAKGHLPCDVLFLGEAPGASEDATGIPLFGPAGHKLDEVEAEAFQPWPQLRRAYTNLVGCYPRVAKEAGINEPKGEEVQACAERLREIVALARPRLVVFLGAMPKRWWPRSVPENFWPAIGIGPPQTCHVMHPAGILRLIDLHQWQETRSAIATLRSALRRVFAPPAVV